MANSGEVKLLSLWASPFAMRVMIALNMKSVEYELQEEIITSKSELLLKSNPVYKKVPVLIHAGKPVSESLVIVQYIDEVWSSYGPSILPSDPYDRAVARFWAAYIDDKWFVSLGELMEKAEDEEAKKAAISQVEEGLSLLEKAFKESTKGKGFFNGENIGYVDIVLGSFLAWLDVIELAIGKRLVDETRTPILSEWAERFRNDPLVKPFVPEVDKLLEFAKAMFPKAFSA